MTRFHSRQLLLLIALITLTVVVLFVGRPDAASSARLEEGPLTLPPAQPEATVNSCRYGVSAVGSNANFVYDMRAGWMVDFGAHSNVALPDIEYIPTVRIQQQRDPITQARLPNYTLTSPTSMAALAAMVQTNPGLIWQIGNEVDRVYVQDDIMPQVYAKAYHEIYQVIKANDSTAQVAPSALVQVTPARLQYLDIVWNTYYATYKQPMPVDVWNMHVYILPEAEYDGAGNLVHSRAGIALGTDPGLAILFSHANPALCSQGNVYCVAEHDDVNIFIQQVFAMRQWMKAHGQQHKPLILSEFSTLYPYLEPAPTDPTGPSSGCPGCYTAYDEFGKPFDRTRVTNFMNAALTFLGNATDPTLGYSEDNYRLVQQWNWFAVNDNSISSSNNLVQDDRSGLTMMGQTYKAWAAAHGFGVNLRVSDAPSVAVKSVSGAATAQLGVTFRNNGNTRTLAPFQVTFYGDAAMTQPIGSTVVPAGVMGCATRPYSASVVWSGLTPGVHRYWVKLDSTSVLGETSETDNVGSGFVIVDPQRVYLPRQ
jgi:hypothetical protein